MEKQIVCTLHIKFSEGKITFLQYNNESWNTNKSMCHQKAVFIHFVFSTSTDRTWDVYDPLFKKWFIAIIIIMNRWILNYFQNYFHPCKSPLPNILIWISAFTSVLCIYNSTFYMPCFMLCYFCTESTATVCCIKLSIILLHFEINFVCEVCLLDNPYFLVESRWSSSVSLGVKEEDYDI